MKWNRDKKTVGISRLAACLFLWIAGGLLLWPASRHRFYAFPFQERSWLAENREHSDQLAKRDQTAAGKTEEIEGVQEQPADVQTAEPEKQEESEKQEEPEIEKRVEIGEWGLDVEQAVRALRRHWEQDNRQDGYSVSMTLSPNLFEEDQKPADAERELQGMQEALCTLAGTEYAEMIREAMAQEEGYLWFVRLEQVGELTCCTFEVTEPASHPDTYERFDEEADDFVYTDIGYYIIVEGKWEGKEVSRQCFRVPYTFGEMYSIGIATGYSIEAVDFNFDGMQDLLIHEGTGYRALVWKEETGQFAYFPSFPENVHLLQFDRKRVVNRGHIGGCHEFIAIFEIVNGEYECTKGLVCEFHNGIYELSYYEMGELVETHMLSDEEWERERQRVGLYPDMAYWMQG